MLQRLMPSIQQASRQCYVEWVVTCLCMIWHDMCNDNFVNHDSVVVHRQGTNFITASSYEEVANS